MKQGSDNGPKHPKKTNVVSMKYTINYEEVSFATR